MIDGSWVMCTNCKELMEKARQQLKDKLCGCGYLPDELLPFDKCPSCMIIDEVLK